jgi:hypothetical protein
VKQIEVSQEELRIIGFDMDDLEIGLLMGSTRCWDNEKVDRQRSGRFVPRDPNLPSDKSVKLEKVESVLSLGGLTEKAGAFRYRVVRAMRSLHQPTGSDWPAVLSQKKRSYLLAGRFTLQKLELLNCRSKFPSIF